MKLTVQQLINQLQKKDPNALILFAYDEYGRTGGWGNMVDGTVAVNSDGSIYIDDDNSLVTAAIPEKDEKMTELNIPEGVKMVPVVKLFAS